MKPVIISKKVIKKIKELYRSRGLYVPRSVQQWRELLYLLICEGLCTSLNLDHADIKEFFKSIKLIFLLILCSLPIFSAHYVNLNVSDERELLSVPGITPQVVNAILVYRQKYGEFKTVSEIYNACWEMSIPVSEEYVRYLTSQANLYAVSKKNWLVGLADTVQDLIHPTVCYYRKTDGGVNYLFKLYDGGIFVVLTRNVDISDVTFFRGKMKRSLFLKPIIDWLVVTKPDIDFIRLLDKFRVKNIYVPFKYLKSLNVEVKYVERGVEIDCYQSYPFYVVVEPIEKSRLSVIFCYDDPRIVISPHPMKSELRCNPVVEGYDMFLFDGALMYYPQKGKNVVKKTRRSVVAEQERARLYEEFREYAIQDLYDEIESAVEK